MKFAQAEKNSLKNTKDKHSVNTNSAPNFPYHLGSRHHNQSSVFLLTILVVKSQEIAQSFRVAFEALWKLSKPA